MPRLALGVSGSGPVSRLCRAGPFRPVRRERRSARWHHGLSYTNVIHELHVPTFVQPNGKCYVVAPQVVRVNSTAVSGSVSFSIRSLSSSEFSFALCASAAFVAVLSSSKHNRPHSTSILAAVKPAAVQKAIGQPPPLAISHPPKAADPAQVPLLIVSKAFHRPRVFGDT